MVIDLAFRELVKQADTSLGGLAVVFDKNPMEASGYAAVMAERLQEHVWMVEFYDQDPDPSVKWNNGVMYIRTPEKGNFGCSGPIAHPQSGFPFALVSATQHRSPGTGFQ